MITKADLAKGIDYEAVTQEMLDIHPNLWAELMACRGETRKNVLVLLSGDSSNVAPERSASLPVNILTLEQGQAVVEVSGLDDEPRVRVVKIDGTAEWQMREYAEKHPLPRVIPIDENTVLVMDDPADPYTASQEDPRVVDAEGVDEAA